MAAWPCLTSMSLSTANVEYVVYAPRNPVATKGRRSREGGKRSRISAMTNPSTKLPETLVTNVAHGKVPDSGVDHLGDAVPGGGPQSRSEGDRHEHRPPDPPRAHGAAGYRGIDPGRLRGVGRRRVGVEGQLFTGRVVPTRQRFSRAAR